MATVRAKDPLGFTNGGDAASFRRRRYVELKHGRVAMLACLGSSAIRCPSASDWMKIDGCHCFLWFGQCGVTKMVGFEPASLCPSMRPRHKGWPFQHVSHESRRFRESVRFLEPSWHSSQIANPGYIVPEYYRWPGDLSSSLGLKFSDVPTGFAAFGKARFA